MSSRIELLPEAEREVEDAFRWYERQRIGLGWSFLLSFEAALDRIRLTPDVGPHGGRDDLTDALPLEAGRRIH